MLLAARGSPASLPAGAAGGEVSDPANPRVTTSAGVQPRLKTTVFITNSPGSV